MGKPPGETVPLNFQKLQGETTAFDTVGKFLQALPDFMVS